MDSMGFRIVTVTNEDPKDLQVFLNKSLSLSYEQFLRKHNLHPSYQKNLFYLLKKNNDIITMFANRYVSLFKRDLKVILFGDVATKLEFRKMGCLKYLVKDIILDLQENEDLMINPWTGRGNYERVYSKLGFNNIKKLKTAFPFYKNIAQTSQSPFYSFNQFHHFRLRYAKETKRQIIISILLYFQFIFLKIVYSLLNYPNYANNYDIDRVKSLNDFDISKVNNLFETYASGQAKNFFARDNKIWDYICNNYHLYLIKQQRKIVGYSIVSFTDDALQIEELFTKDLSLYFYAIKNFENIAKFNGKREIIIWSDINHHSIVRCGYIPYDLTIALPFDSNVAVARLSKSFYKKIKVKCRISIYDELLNKSVEIGDGNFILYIKNSDMEDLLFGYPTFLILFKLKIIPIYKIFSAYKILSRVKKEYAIDDFLRTQIDRY